MGASMKGTNRPKRKTPPATTVEGRENQLINSAINLAEKQLHDGTASAQVIVHYLKLGTTRERLEKEKLMEENRLLKAKTERLKAEADTQKLFQEAIEAMRIYNGRSSEEDDELDES